MGVQLVGRRTTLVKRPLLGDELHAWLNWRLHLIPFTASVSWRGSTWNTSHGWSGFNSSRAFNWWPRWARGLIYRDSDRKR